MISFELVVLRRLRALLHLVDGDVDDEDDAPRAARLRQRCFRVARVLVDRFERDPQSVVRRTLVAALAGGSFAWRLARLLERGAASA